MESGGRSSPKRLPSLTGLRAIAALAVFSSHLRWVLPNVQFGHGNLRITSDEVLVFGAQGVTLFFVLSGFVLAWGASTSIPVRSFLRRRFARVWPAHATLWVTFMVMGALGIVTTTSAVPALANLALVQTWIPGLGWANTVNPLAWTLSCEAFFYLTFLPIHRMLKRLGSEGLAATAIACVAFGATISVFFLGPRGITVSTFPLFRLWEFVLGVVAAIAVRRLAARRSVPSAVGPGFAAMGILAIVLCVAALYPELESLASFVPAICFVVLVSALALRDTRPSSDKTPLLASPAAQYGGQVSYGFYLVQLVPLALITFVIGDVEGTLERFAIAGIWFIATLGLAMALYHGVERPAARRISRGRSTISDHSGLERAE